MHWFGEVGFDDCLDPRLEDPRLPVRLPSRARPCVHSDQHGRVAVLRFFACDDDGSDESDPAEPSAPPRRKQRSAAAFIAFFTDSDFDVSASERATGARTGFDRARYDGSSRSGAALGVPCLARGRRGRGYSNAQDAALG